MLRHLPGCHTRDPQSSGIALKQLVQRWPAYVKGMAAPRLEEKLDLEGARRVAGIDEGFAALLEAIGLG
nr:hypothetical protein [Sphingopyxis sp. YR583]